MRLIISALIASCSLSFPALAAPGDLIKLEPQPQSSFSHSALLTLEGKISDALKGAGIIASFPTPKTGVTQYKITYETVDLGGNPTPATGIIIIPDSGRGAYPLVTYEHETMTGKSEVPSVSPEGDNMWGAFYFASRGYVAVEPDYLGFGGSVLPFHPYHDSNSLASVSVDLLRAVRKAAVQLQITLDSQLFIAGYSEGGKAALALQRLLERDPEKEFKVTATAGLEGGYIASEILRDNVLKNSDQDSVLELAYLLNSCSRMYPLFCSLNQTLQPLMVDQLGTIFNGEKIITEVVTSLPKTLDELILPAFKEQLLNGTSPFIEVLRINDLPQENLIDWKPRAPIKLYHAQSDTDCGFKNAEIAQQRIQLLGGNVRLINLGDKLTHETAFFPAITKAANWFDSIRKNKAE